MIKQWITTEFLNSKGKLNPNKTNEEWFYRNNYNDKLDFILNKTSFLQKPNITERIYCVLNEIDSYPKCANDSCNILLIFKDYRHGYRNYCSSKCASKDKKAQEKTKNTWIKNYGVDHPSKSPKIQQKIRNTWMEKYGVNHVFQSKELREKAKKTCLERYGVEHYTQSNEGKEKIKQIFHEKYDGKHPFQTQKVQKKFQKTCLNKYGVDQPLKSEIIKNKIIETNLKKYKHKSSLQSSKIRDKIRKTNLERYGNEIPSKNKQVQNKMRKTNLERFGVPNFNQKHYTKLILNQLENKEFLTNLHHVKNMNLQEIANHLGISATPIKYRFHKYKIPINYNYSCSSYEKEITTFINNKNIQPNARNIISPYELDIFISEYKLAIEFNGLFWHSFNHKETLEQKNKHLLKTKMCEEQNIQLLHIFENEWLDEHKQEIWKSIINSKVGKNDRIFARKCEVKEIKDNKLVRNFLNNNHLQGFAGSSIKIGLFYKDELVSLITFGKTRYSKQYQYEIIRFCNKKYINVVGGASKLFKYFVRNYEPESVISYADKRYSNGKLYEKLGFEYSHDSNSNYFYFKINENILYPRIKFQKHKLEKQLEIFDSKLSEVENMFNNGYRRIWDCGNKIFIWRKIKNF